MGRRCRKSGAGEQGRRCLLVRVLGDLSGEDGVDGERQLHAETSREHSAASVMKKRKDKGRSFLDQRKATAD